MTIPDIRGRVGPNHNFPVKESTIMRKTAPQKKNRNGGAVYFRSKAAVSKYSNNLYILQR